MISASQCRSARTLLRWSVSKRSNAASVSESAIDDFELERGEPSAITADAIWRAFEGVGVGHCQVASSGRVMGNQQRWGQAAGATSATSCHVQKAALRAVRYWLALR